MDPGLAPRAEDVARTLRTGECSLHRPNFCSPAPKRQNAPRRTACGPRLRSADSLGLRSLSGTGPRSQQEVAMRTLRLVALSDDGQRLIVAIDGGDSGERFEIPIDDRLRAAAR